MQADTKAVDELEQLFLFKCDPAQWVNPELGANLKGSIVQILNTTLALVYYSLHALC